MIRYTKDHEWVRLDGTIATVGITTTRRTRWATWCSSSCRSPGAR